LDVATAPCFATHWAAAKTAANPITIDMIIIANALVFICFPFQSKIVRYLAARANV
jgi:hypothetical protein